MRTLIKFVLLMVFFNACSDNPANDSDSEDISWMSRKIKADSGGSINVDDGTNLTIFSESLPADTTITVKKLSANKVDNLTYASISFEPEGLELNKPAIVSIPLPDTYTDGDMILIYEGRDYDISKAVFTGKYAHVKSTDDGLVAETFVTHFSHMLFIRNCHSGTLDFVLSEFGKKGCHKDSARARVEENFPGEHIDWVKKEKINEKSIQRFLDTFFENKYTYNKGQDVGTDVIEEISAYADEGRTVVLAFTSGEWQLRNADGFFQKFAHTAVLEKKNGVMQIRNAANVDRDPILIKAMGGTNIIHYPLEDLNEFRNFQSGVPVELQVGGEPDCLSDPSKNPYGLDPYPPLNGKGWGGTFIENPIDVFFAVLDGHSVGIPPRGKPWTAVKIYVLKANAEDNPCVKEQKEEITYNRYYVELKLYFREPRNSKYIIPFNKYIEGTGKLEGHTFTASWDSSYVRIFNTLNIDVHQSGSLSVAFVADFDSLKTYHFTDTVVENFFVNNESITQTTYFDLQGKNFPLGIGCKLPSKTISSFVYQVKSNDYEKEYTALYPDAEHPEFQSNVNYIRFYFWDLPRVYP